MLASALWVSPGTWRAAHRTPKSTPLQASYEEQGAEQPEEGVQPHSDLLQDVRSDHSDRFLLSTEPAQPLRDLLQHQGSQKQA